MAVVFRSWRSIEVAWPSGRKQVIRNGLTDNQTLKIAEPGEIAYRRSAESACKALLGAQNYRATFQLYGFPPIGTIHVPDKITSRVTHRGN
jgi:hypothetical protein